jgi:transcriptional regulator with PAS, ATPase and Fis domain
MIHAGDDVEPKHEESANSGISIDEIPADLLMALLDNPYESLILIDASGVVRFMSSSNEGIYPIPVKDAIGRHITEVSADTRMPRILQTRKAEIGRSMVLKNQHRVVARIPLFKDGRVVGAAGKLMFMSPEKLKELYGRIEVLKNNLDFYKETLNQVYGSRYTFENIIGNSALSLQAKALAAQAAESDSPVLIVGESGTGKELFAHAIHQISRRRNHNFVKVNSASIPGELIESELFGYEPGAFTGARKQGKPGKFELAHQGTIFLDEIGDMPHLLQVKLMRVLQEKEVERIGGKTRQIDFRVISATNLDLEAMVREKTFRLDLFYRLNVIIIRLPPLRDIREDILPIFTIF